MFDTVADMSSSSGCRGQRRDCSWVFLSCPYRDAIVGCRLVRTKPPGGDLTSILAFVIQASTVARTPRARVHLTFMVSHMKILTKLLFDKSTEDRCKC